MKDKSFLIWAVAAVIFLAVLNLPPSVSGPAKSIVREGVAPLQSVIASFSSKVREIVRSARGIGGALADNRKMEAELVLLRSQASDFEKLERENAELREQLMFVKRARRQLIPCEVIARDITGWWETIRLGKGSTDGVGPDMAVITPDGLVGKTIDVSTRTCDVLLISDVKCKVSARIARTGSFGVVAGGGPSRSGQTVCHMEFMNKNTPILAGDEVMTSGLGGVFPPGLLIGYVEKAYADETGLFQKADILPKADLGALTYVFVVAEQGNPVDEYLKKMEVHGEESPAAQP